MIKSIARVAVLAVVLVAGAAVADDIEADLDRAMQAYNQKDYETAVELFQSWADKGDPRAQYMMAIVYNFGRGVTLDPKVAFDWYKRAADQGFAKAQFVVGQFYREGRVVEKNDREAFEWYKRAAEQGNARAQGNLGVMYAKGKGTEKDEITGFMWMVIGMIGGDDYAKRSATTMKRILPKADRKIAADRAREWVMAYRKQKQGEQQR